MLEIGAVFEFLFGWQFENLVADCELTVDLVLGQAEVRDVAVCLSANLYNGTDFNMRKGRLTRSQPRGLRC